jgi:hypothetical protein
MSELLGLTEELVSGLEKVKRVVDHLEVQETGNTGTVVDPIINKQFEVWQRNTTFSLVSGLVTQIADRWQAFGNSTVAVSINRTSFTLGQTEVPNTPVFYLRAARISTGTGGSAAFIQQCVEDIRTFEGKTVCVSFWMRSNLANTNLSVDFHSWHGISGSARVIQSVIYNTGTASTWQFKSVYVTLPSLSSKTLDFATASSNPCLIVRFALPANASFTYDITNVQLDFGEYPRPFRRKLLADEFISCFRYYQKSFTYSRVPAAATSDGSGSYQFNTPFAGTFTHFLYIPLKATMRVVPTLTYYGVSTAGNEFGNASIPAACTGTATQAGTSESSIRVNTTQPNATTAGQIISGHWVAEADFAVL